MRIRYRAAWTTVHFPIEVFAILLFKFPRRVLVSFNAGISCFNNFTVRFIDLTNGLCAGDSSRFSCNTVSGNYNTNRPGNSEFRGEGRAG